MSLMLIRVVGCDGDDQSFCSSMRQCNQNLAQCMFFFELKNAYDSWCDPINDGGSFLIILVEGGTSFDSGSCGVYEEKHEV